MDQKQVTLEIVELKRSGGTSALTIRVSARAGASGAQVAQTFDDGLSEKLKDATDSGDTLDGISRSIPRTASATWSGETRTGTASAIRT